MEKWTKERYKQLCKDSNDQAQEYPDVGEEHYHEFAIIALREERGLKAWMKKEFKCPDLLGRLTDDMAYPGNCD